MSRLLRSLFCLLLFISTPLHAATIQLPQTGQTTSYAAGDDGDIRVGKAWPTPRFIDNRDGTLTDQLTGLLLTRDANLLKSRDPAFDSDGGKEDGAVTWQHALDYIKKLNSENYLGYHDWRLPNLVEVASLLNLGQTGNSASLSAEGFYAVEERGYWSSTSSVSDPRFAWTVTIDTGPVALFEKNKNAYVWPVRTGKAAGPARLPTTGQTACFDSSGTRIPCTGTGQDGELQTGATWPMPRFTANDDQTITDNLTGLTWATDANLAVAREPGGGSGQMNWQSALEYVTKLNSENYLGFGDWRLPNRSELASIVSHAEAEPSVWLKAAGITNLMQSYWSSSTAASDPANAWTVNPNGVIADQAKLESVGSYLWPVRGGLDRATPVLEAAQATAKPLAMQAAAANLTVSTATLPGGTIGVSYSQSLAATGGTTPYTWSKTTGSLPAGLTLSSAGVISGMPTTAATNTFTVQVKDAVNATATKSLSIIVSAAPPTITTTQLPDGYLSTAYSQTLAATGGKTPYTWSKTSGSLPAGLSLNTSTGAITGTPTSAGTSSFTVQVKDANNATATKTLSIITFAALSISTSSLPAATVGATYNQTLTAAGGKTPFTWSVSSGTLPAGLTLAANGSISGTPTATASASVTFMVSDANGKTATKALTMTVNIPPLTISTTSLASGAIGTPYSQTLAATGGKAPYSWSRTSGSLPTGLTLSSSGTISGTPTATGSKTFTVQVKDAANATTTKSLTITISPAVTITTSSLEYGLIGATYSQTFAASGGTPPYSWSVVSGSLPPGLSLNPSSGTISGVPSTDGWSSFTIQVTDAGQGMANAGFSIYVNPPLSITTSAMPDVYAGSPYNAKLIAKAGSQPYYWTIIDGALPQGLSLDPSSGAVSGTPTVPGTSNFTVKVTDIAEAASTATLSIRVLSFAAVTGRVTDQSSGLPLAGTTVTLQLSGIVSKDPNDLLVTCNGTAITDYPDLVANDGVKNVCNTKVGQNVMLFKARNPYGRDPFIIIWNGIAAHSDYTPEYLAQSFKPTRSGTLNQVSFSLPFNLVSYQGGTVSGNVYVLLKSKLGGDRGSYLAKSDPVYLENYRSGAPQWVNFTFSTPPQVTAGQEYFLEINGTYFDMYGGAYLYELFWGGAVANQDGFSYTRYGGIWRKETYSLAFQTYLDGVSDIATVPDPAAYNYMYGGNSVDVGGMIYSPSTGDWPGSLYIDTNFPDSDGVRRYNGDDLTGVATVNPPDSYYDANGWVTVNVSTYSTWPTSLVTDQFSLSFSRTLTTTTDAAGNYTFPAVLDGNYTITFDKPLYVSQTVSGTVAPDQNLNIPASMAPPPPASLQGTVSCNGIPVAGALVTVTDPLGVRSAVADAQGNYRVSGISSGAYTVTFDAAWLNRLTLTGSLAPGQAGTQNAVMLSLPVSLAVTSPADGAVVTVLPLAVSGTVQNADTVTVTAVNDGNSTSYPAIVAGGSFTASLPLEAGDTILNITATNRYGGTSAKMLTVTRAPFTIKNLGDVGNVAVMEVTGSYDAKNPGDTWNVQPRQAIATEYFRNHSDLDFLVLLSTFDYAMPEGDAKGYYTPVKNDVQGINQPIFDDSLQYGSSGKLQGTIDLGNVTALAANPYGPKLEETVTTLSHEMMHRFGAFVRFKNPDGSLNSALLGKDSSHWSYLLDSKGSVMYGNGWKDNGNGSYTSTSATSGYSPLDLYLMAMIPKDQVPPMLLIENSAIDKTQLPHLGDTVTGTAKTITIDDIIAAEGARIPDAAGAQKSFKVGFVVLTRPETSTGSVPAAIEVLRNAWAGRFAAYTHGAGGIANVAASLAVRIDSPSDGATVTGPGVTVTGTIINSTGVETGVIVNGVPATITGNQFIANHVPLQIGVNTLSVEATDANGLTASTGKNITSATGNYIRISTNIEAGVAPIHATLRVDGSFPISGAHLTVNGPVAVTLGTGVDATEFNLDLTTEGTYTITATVTAPDGQIYGDSVMILVVSRLQLESELKSKWDGINKKLIQNDIEGALSFLVTDSRSGYRELFTALGSNLTQIAQATPPLEFVYAYDDRAKCRVFRQETVQGRSVTVGYPVYFEREDGIWRLIKY